MVAAGIEPPRSHEPCLQRLCRQGSRPRGVTNHARVEFAAPGVTRFLKILESGLEPMREKNGCITSIRKSDTQPTRQSIAATPLF